MNRVRRSGRHPRFACWLAVLVVFVIADAVGSAGNQPLSSSAAPAHVLYRPQPLTLYHAVPLFGNPYADAFGHLELEEPVGEIESRARAELARLEQAGQGGSLASGDLLDFINFLLTVTGQLASPEAAQLAERAVRIKEQHFGPRHDEVAESLARLGGVYAAQADFASARAAYERALEFATTVKMACTERLVRLRLRMGDYAGTRQLLEELLTSAPAQEYRRMGYIGSALVAMGDYDNALPLLERANELTHHVKKPVPTWAYYLAVALWAQGDIDGAREKFQAAFEGYTRVYSADHPFKASALYGLAAVEAQSGKPGKARGLLERAAAIQKATLAPDHPDTALTRIGLAEVLMLEGNVAAARPLYEQALPLLRRALDGLDPSLPSALASRAWFHFQVEERSRAMELSLEAEDLARRHFHAALSAISEREALGYDAIRLSGLNLALTLLAESIRPVAARRIWDEMIRSRAEVLDEMATRHRTALSLRDPEVARQRAELARARHRLTRFMFQAIDSGDPERYQAALQQARTDKELAERALAASSVGLGPSSAEGPPRLQDVSAALPERSALVAYVRYDHWTHSAPTPAYLALILQPPKLSVQVVPLGSASRIDQAVVAWKAEVSADPRQWRSGARVAEARYVARSRRLRELIWDPVARRLDDYRLVFVVPDGELSLVNLAVLPSDGEGYLVERGPMFHYLSAERDLLSRRPAAQRSHRVLVVGDPAFDLPPTGPGESPATSGSEAPQGESHSTVYRTARAGCDELRQLDFKKLPGTRDEVDALRSLMTAPTEVTVLLGARASESAIKNLAPSHEVLHLATHGFFVSDRCDSVLTPGRSTAEAVSPLVLSGLAFAGANRRHEIDPESDAEDGILTAEEISSLDLTGVDWVVLSACETGIGRARAGEGVLGLRRAFEVAGAGTLIMSLWAVEDDATRLWMTSLYEARLAGMSTVEAVRRASLDRLEAARSRGRSIHPFFWGAFVAAGDWK